MRVIGRPYRIVTFLGAFLLFLIQPLIARFMLPYFGGAAAVWTTSLVFFTAMLCAGYTYVYVLGRLSARVQAFIHFGVIVVALATFVLWFYLFGSMFPPLAWITTSALPPAGKVLAALALLIGIPYFLLSTTAPLVQAWYGAMESKEPYHLYALSNAASFIALAAYPFIVEPTFTLSFQRGAWVVLFILFAAVLALLTRSFAKAQPHTVTASPVAWSDALFWTGFAALPAALLVATTSQLTQVVAPVPFIWVIPLALYLLSFILAFRGYGRSGMLPTLVIVSACVSFSFLGFNVAAVSRQMLAYLVFFFFTSWYCNAELYAARPEKSASSLLYVWVSFGGMWGTLAVAIGAPLVFNDVLEFPLGILLAIGVAVSLFPAMRYVRDEYERSVMVLRVIVLAAVFFAGVHYFNTANDAYMYKSRNFYGIAKISESGGVRMLYNGTTFHGDQFLDAARTYEPTTYYSPQSGIGLAFAYERTLHHSLAIGVIGLGTGSSAAYCTSGDHFTFYDIDARIENIARTQFSYLAHCAGNSVKIGDGRLLLAQEVHDGAPKLDLLVVDAFSDDTIPAHLLTMEALKLYLSRLRDDKSIIVIHTSNRFLTLSPVVVRIARELKLASAVVYVQGNDLGATTSQWVLLARDPRVIASKKIAAAASPPSPISAPLWTDDYMNIFATLRLPSLYNFNY